MEEIHCLGLGLENAGKKEEIDGMEEKQTGSIGSIHQERNAVEDNLDYNLEDLKNAEGLTNDEEFQLRDVLFYYRRCFSKQPGVTHLAEHRIETGDSQPIREGPWRVSMVERRIIQEQVE